MSDMFKCKSCGHSVAWKESKKGNRYLAQPLSWSSDEGNERTYWPSHKCVSDPEWIAGQEQREEERIEAAIESGQIVKGSWVDVVKGRKVPIGTHAEVFWIGDNGYGESVGLKVTGESVFTSATNVELVRA